LVTLPLLSTGMTESTQTIVFLPQIFIIKMASAVVQWTDF
jgi:hypothetical protein